MSIQYDTIRKYNTHGGLTHCKLISMACQIVNRKYIRKKNEFLGEWYDDNVSRALCFCLSRDTRQPYGIHQSIYVLCMSAEFELATNKAAFSRRMNQILLCITFSVRLVDPILLDQRRSKHTVWGVWEWLQTSHALHNFLRVISEYCHNENNILRYLKTSTIKEFLSIVIAGRGNVVTFWESKYWIPRLDIFHTLITVEDLTWNSRCTPAIPIPIPN